MIARLAAALSLLAAFAAPAAAVDWSWPFGGGEEESSPLEHPWAEPARVATAEEIEALGIDADVVGRVRSHTSGDPRLLRGADAAPIGLVWPVPSTASTGLVRGLRAELAPRGLAFFVARRRFGIGADEVALVKVEDPLDVLDRLGTPGEEAGLSTADLRRRLDEWARIAEWSLLGAGRDWIEIDFDPVPVADVLARILDESATLAPSAVPADPELRGRLGARVVAERRLSLHWD